MSNVYVSLGVTPRKKRQLVTSDDESTYTPKRLRNAPPTPPQSARKNNRAIPSNLPPHLSRLNTIQTALQHALSHALATCAVSPSDTGIVRNVLNHISIATYSGLTTKFDVNDLKRLCWIWEWDGKTISDGKGRARAVEDENPFLDSPPAPPKDWMRGSMGFVISPTSHYSKSAGKRVPVYGLGIEVEVDIDKDMSGGMAAVARWTAEADKRRAEFRLKLESWVKLHPDVTPIPNVPFADLPEIVNAIKASSLTLALASASPKGAAILENIVSSTPTSPSKSPIKSPVKRSSAAREFAVPFPVTNAQCEGVATSKNTLLFPRTPSSREKRADPLAKLLTPQTPARKQPQSEECVNLAVTPVHQRGSNAETAPATPSTSRRQALYDRVRLKSLTSTPSKAKESQTVGGKLTRDQIQKMGQEEIRRRCLLGRLGGVAESIWMLFSSPVGSASTPTTRKRKALPASEVAAAIIKSSPVPMSALEASESIKLLTGLCPFFIKPFEVGGEEWFEMPSTVSTSENREASGRRGAFSSPTKSSEGNPPPSPRLFGGTVVLSPGSCFDSAGVLTRSPRRVKREIGGLREVREIVRRELELQD